MFARCRDRWLTIGALLILLRGSNKFFGKSALYVAVKELSKPMATLGDQSYIDRTTVGTGSGKPMKYKLGRAAYEKIYALVEHESIRSKPYLHPLKGRGRIRIPPLAFEKKFENKGLRYEKTQWLPARDIIDLVERKIGTLGGNQSLKNLTSKQAISKLKPYAKKV